MTLPPWDYLFESFNSENFPDIFYPTWIAALVLLIVLTVLYNVRTRALHRHAIYLEMWEWLWWTGLITFSLILIESLFVFDYLPGPADPDHRPRGAGLDPLRPLPAVPRRLRGAPRARALLQAEEVRRSRGHDQEARRRPAASSASGADGARDRRP